MRDKSKRLESIHGTFGQVLEKLGLAEQMVQYKAVLHWEKVAGVQTSRHTQAYSIDKGRLLVMVDSHVWIRELTFLKSDLIRRLNAELGAETVKDIRFSLMTRRPADGQGPG